MFVNYVNLDKNHTYFQFTIRILLTPTIMKALHTLKSLLAIFALLFIILNSYAQDEPSNQWVGTWTKSMNEASVQFMISSDNTWEVEFTGDDEADVYGTYQISGNQITLTDKGGEYSSDSSGDYVFQVDNDSLKFTTVDDPVDGRRMLVAGTWTLAREGDQ
jgi:hypothetical protein